MSWTELARSMLGRFPAMSIAILAAAGGFVAIERGSLRGGGVSARAYADAVHHEVAPVVTGRVSEVRVHVGQRVKRGDVIAVMDDRLLLAARERALAELAKRRAEVSAALSEQDARVTRSELALLRARAAEQGDRARLQEVARQISRLDDLLERKMIPAGDAESAREKGQELSARVESYDRARVLGARGAAERDHRSAVEARIEPYKRAVAVQEAAVAELERALEDLTLRSPCDGAVTTLWRRSGDVAAAATPIVTIVEARPGTLVVILPEVAASRIAIGDRAKLERDRLFSRPIEGRVVELSPEIEEMPLRARASPMIPVWGRRALIEVPAGDELVPGEAFHVTLR
ncbi:MAG: biotin/lipoyl-binding protein [Labilithrix sp.]|nr:biotin/lipoyl-binding protein [Labilithrix sp.]